VILVSVTRETSAGKPKVEHFKILDDEDLLIVGDSRWVSTKLEHSSGTHQYTTRRHKK
jgi:hypothetical protein